MAQAREFSAVRLHIPTALQADRGSRDAPGPGRGSPPPQFAKRGGGGQAVWVTFDEALDQSASCQPDVLQLDNALDELARLNPRQAVMVECRFFGGVDVSETAELLDISEATVLRDWRAAKAWLAHGLRQGR